MSALRFYIIIPAGAEERDNEFQGISDANEGMGRARLRKSFYCGTVLDHFIRECGLSCPTSTGGVVSPLLKKIQQMSLARLAVDLAELRDAFAKAKPGVLQFARGNCEAS